MKLTDATIYEALAKLDRVKVMLDKDTWWGKQNYVNIVLFIAVVIAGLLRFGDLQRALLVVQAGFAIFLIGRRTYLMRQCGKILKSLDHL